VAGSFGRHGHAGDGLFEVAGVPQDDGGYEQVEAGGAIGLVLEPAVAQFAELVEEQRAGERVARLSLVESGLGAPAQVDVAQPVEHENRAFDPPDLTQCQRKAVLTWIGGQPAQHGGGGDGAAADRGDEAEQFVPMVSDVADRDRIAGQSGEQRPGILAAAADAGVVPSDRANAARSGSRRTA
jgi:hypothetical protein